MKAWSNPKNKANQRTDIEQTAIKLLMKNKNIDFMILPLSALFNKFTNKRKARFRFLLQFYYNLEKK